MNTRDREPLRALRAFNAGGDTRALKRELKAGNRYAHAKLASRGLAWECGAIVQPGDGLRAVGHHTREWLEDYDARQRDLINAAIATLDWHLAAGESSRRVAAAMRGRRGSPAGFAITRIADHGPIAGIDARSLALYGIEATNSRRCVRLYVGDTGTTLAGLAQDTWTWP